jgi:hypothetical protein
MMPFSIWLIVLIVIMCAVMMHPSFISFIVILMVFALLFLLRWVSKHEAIEKIKEKQR